ncbi:uncharacterized protein LOC127877818 [Dreissena polymorpha]|uniref:Uncharacterized protein n=1 Tax=Dreissena polymorpha TaxID=45954 RepID=A0A9D4HAM4_DREPO|nr:uncharacterized protein LOC127877818 [Dreissena polymorpha]KAH3829991.1 hypothetical protein DPMN_103225 [Dreissena polymorpha]
MRMRPSNVFYSQDSISRTFVNGGTIGDMLDDICEGRKGIYIFTITVVNRNGKWVTTDNRRLWVFRQLERLGKCSYIDVDVGYTIPEEKMTSSNGGVSVHVRGGPGGYWHEKSSSSNTCIKWTIVVLLCLFFLALFGLYTNAKRR